MIALYNTATGELVSIGTVVVNPLPAGTTTLDIGADSGLLDGTSRWDVATRTVIRLSPSPAELDANRVSLEGKATTALTGNATFLALASPSNAQIAAQVKALTRQNNALIKLWLNRFEDVTGT